MNARSGILVWLLAAYLAAAATAAFASGLWNAWALGIDHDMQARAAEYQAFRDGVYPNSTIDRAADEGKPPYSVYPPYALPMFAVFFEPGGVVQGRIVVEALSAAALLLIGVCGRNMLAGHGLAWAAVGALAAAAVTVNRSVISLGQFSAVCMGFVFLQIAMLERGRPFAAGACWAAAMIKPQIGLAFFALFLVNRQWRGLVFGVAILVILGLFALWWTEVSPAVLVHHWLFHTNMKFAASSSGFGPAAAAEWLGWDHSRVQYAMLAVLAGVMAAVVRFVIRDILMPDLMPLAAICAVLGRVLFYHGVYDQVMLAPLLLACLSAALTTPGWRGGAVTGAVAATLWVPQRVWELVPGQEFLQPAIWILAAVYVGAVMTTPRCDDVGSEP